MRPAKEYTSIWMPFNPRFQGTYFVSSTVIRLVQEVPRFPFNPRFQGTYFVSVYMAGGKGGVKVTFNPRFQGTYFVRQQDNG